MGDRAQQALAVLVGAWALAASTAGMRAAWTQPVDPMQRLEAEFAPLASSLPPVGEVGYLERYEHAGAEDAVRVRYAAQYALAPRVVASRVGPEFIIVAADAERPGGDSRLVGYFLVSSSPAGHRVFRRLTP
jgi:hypothetical protein